MEAEAYAELNRLRKSGLWGDALAKVDVLLLSNPFAVQLYLLHAELIQLQDENTGHTLEDAEASLKRAFEIDPNNFDVLVDLMHFYDVICPNPSKAIEYATKVKSLARKALDEANEILEDNVSNIKGQPNGASDRVE